MQGNVIYGAFGQTRAPETSQTTTIARVDENTPATLYTRINASLKVLGELATLIDSSGLPQEDTTSLRTKLRDLELTAGKLSTDLLRAQTDDKVFLQAQTEISLFGKQLVEFEAEVMHKTGAELELVEAPPLPMLSQVKQALTPPRTLINSPRFWLGLSAGVAVLGGLVWWGFHKDNKPTDKEDFSTKVQRVKLRRAMPAR